jgi:hypothetical protein
MLDGLVNGGGVLALDRLPDKYPFTNSEISGDKMGKIFLSAEARAPTLFDCLFGALPSLFD